jgi:hypothetical protein
MLSSWHRNWLGKRKENRSWEATISKMTQNFQSQTYFSSSAKWDQFLEEKLTNLLHYLRTKIKMDKVKWKIVKEMKHENLSSIA